MIIKASIPNCFQLKTIPSFRIVLMPKQGEAHHTGGADILLAPLGSEEENRMIGLLGDEGDKEVGVVLTEHNLRLVVYMVKELDDTSVGVEDLISIGTIGLIKAINTFKPDKNIKLATYASRCTENEILMYLRRNNKTRPEVPIDEPLNVDQDGNEPLLLDIPRTDEDATYYDTEDEIEKSLLSNAISRLNSRECKIVELRHDFTNEDEEEMTQKEAADLLGVSQPYISRLGKKIMERLKKEIIKLEQARKASAKSWFFCCYKACLTEKSTIY